MPRTVLFLLPALSEVLDRNFRQIKYSLFPPLSLLTLAALTPSDRYRMLVRDEHVESVEVDEPVDLVAMTVYVSSAQRAYDLADHYRGRGAKVVMGGLHPTVMPNEAARHADAVCIGPAESVWGLMLNDFECGRLQRFYHGTTAGSAALVPTARRDLMNRRAYLVPNTLVTSRGCPHSCSFCYKASFWGERFYEARPLHRVEHELESLCGKFLFLLDDNFLGCRAHARQLFGPLRNSGMVWQASGSLDAADDPGFLAEAYAAGCRSVFVGFESLSKENMRGAGKRTNVRADYAEAVRRFHDAGLMINGSFVFGFDYDGPAVFERTVDFAVENKLETATFHVLTPYPGTRTFARMELDGRVVDRDWSHYDTRHAVFRPLAMTPEKLEDGYRRAYEEFYRWGSILRRSAGLPGMLKRIAYNVGWKKMDRAWELIIRAGLLHWTLPAFEKVLAASTRAPELAPHPSTAPRTAPEPP